MESLHYKLTDAVKRSANPGIDLEQALRSRQIRQWLDRLDESRFNLKGVHIETVDAWGKPVPEVKFVKFKADVTDKLNRPIPGIMFMRGGSVAMLPVFICGRRYYTALTVQPRLPTGEFSFPEIPAGMVDGNGSFAGAAAAEIEQELGMKVTEKELIDLSAMAENAGCFVSPGATDEVIRFFAFVRHVSREWLKEMEGKCTGLLEENEQITLKIVPISTIWKYNDMKTTAAAKYFDVARARGLLVPTTLAA